MRETSTPLVFKRKFGQFGHIINYCFKFTDGKEHRLRVKWVSVPDFAVVRVERKIYIEYIERRLGYRLDYNRRR